jgi:hypothetical protein
MRGRLPICVGWRGAMKADLSYAAAEAPLPTKAALWRVETAAALTS